MICSWTRGQKSVTADKRYIQLIHYIPTCTLVSDFINFFISNAFHLSCPILLKQLELPWPLFGSCHCSGSNTSGILNLITYFMITIFSHICYSRSRQQISWLTYFLHFINTHTHTHTHTHTQTQSHFSLSLPTSLSFTQQTFNKNLEHHYLLAVYCLFSWFHPNPCILD